MPSEVFALDLEDGRPIWVRTLPSPTIRRPLAAFGAILVALTDGLVLLDAASGDTMTAWSWPNSIVGDVATGPKVAFAVRCGKEDSIFNGKRAVIPRECWIVRLNPNGSLQWERESVLRGPRIVWDAARGCLLEACRGLGVWEVDEGRRKHLIPLSDIEGHLTPAIDADRIYMTSTDGSILAFRSPLLPTE